MDGRTIDFAVIHGSNIIMRAEPISTADFASPDAVIEQIGQRICELKEVFPSVAAVGMGLTGFADYKAGTVHSLTRVPGWHDIPIRRILTELSGLPASIDNEAHCAAYAEWKFGAAQGMDDVICLSMGEGIGGGIIANGQFLRGSFGTAAEFGKTSIDYKGRIGHYGNRGEAECYLGTRAICKAAELAYAAAGLPLKASDVSLAALAADAQDGCPVAHRIWQQLAQQLSSLILNCCYMLNPEAIVLNGELALAGDVLMKPLRQQLRSQLFATHYENLRLLPADFGVEGGLIGAAQLALDTLALEHGEA